MAALSKPGAPQSMTLILGLRVLLYLVPGVALLAFGDGVDPIRAGRACLIAAAAQPVLVPLVKHVHHRLVQASFDVIALTAIAILVPSVWYLPLMLVAAGVTLLAAAGRPNVQLVIPGLLIVGLIAFGATDAQLGRTADLAIAAAVLLVATRATVSFRRQQQRTQTDLDRAMLAARAIAQISDIDTGEILEVHGDVGEVTGWPTEEWIARRPADVMHPDDLTEYETAIARLDHVPDLDFVGRIHGQHGDLRWLRYSGRVDVDELGRNILRGMVADVTAVHKIADELHEQARRDRITGLPNRQRLEEDLDLRAVHHTPFALLIADIRQFKAINDTLGHHIGDLVLSMMGSRISQHEPAEGAPGRTVYRLSADQFALVLDDADADQAVATAQQIAQECRRAYYVGRVALGAPIAVGVALSAPNVAPSVTLRQADVALHAAKGANSQVEVYHADMQRFTLENLMLSAAVEHGLDHDEFVLHFQPQVDLRSGLIVGCEGLVRWLHPERGLLPPTEFLETIRVSALFDRFTLSMVRQAALAAASAQGAEHSIGFAVNIEMSSLVSPGFTDKLLAQLDSCHIGHHRVVLEIIETELAEHLAGSTIDPLAELHRLRQGGFEIAIDDFGTGSSSLARLDQVPADEVKLDRSFIQAIGTSERAELLLTSIIRLGNTLGMRVVAEGIEELGQLAFLTQADCRIGQGWLFSKALPVTDLLAALPGRYPVSYPEIGAGVSPLRPRRHA